MKILNFYKELDNRWYIYLPEWKGHKDDLEMVMGADTMLDIISQGEDIVTLLISKKPFDSYNYLLTLREELYEGGMYELSSINFNFEVWLCHVTKFIFGEFPNKIYFK